MYLLDNIYDQKCPDRIPIKNGSVFSWPPGSGSAMQDYGSNPKDYLRIHNTELLLLSKQMLQMKNGFFAKDEMLMMACKIIVD
jgi:hypothetical protein